MTDDGAVSSAGTSSSSPSRPPQTPRRAMEEVWKDISLSSLNQDVPSAPPPSSLHYHHASAPTAAASSYVSGITLQDLLSGAFTEADLIPPACPRRPAALSLGSSRLGPDSNFSNSGGSSSSGRAGIVMIKHDGCGNVADRRKKRMIKNRESAARSRARKQAYTNELEKEVKHLVEENKKLKLKLKQEELRKQTMAAQLPVAKKRQLRRASTAPF
ncbi:protein FD-like [Musa acuminata AAA Group]|uniref:protein FD-like n=1 Tax=Musa acuminata AAA Group TaxID=214697 RepID=UPI0031E47370